MTPRYIVTSSEFWEDIPRSNELACGRTRYTVTQQIAFKSSVFVHKAEAIDEAARLRQQVIREIEYSPNRWQYRLMIDFEPKEKPHDQTRI